MSERRCSESAVSQLFTFLVAGGVFIVAVGTVLMTTQLTGQDSEPVSNAGQEAGAESLADLLVGSAGLGWGGGADAVDRLGLLAANGSGLDIARMDALRGALAEADADNGKVDYAEALASLGMNEGEFHIRIYPVGLQPALFQADLSGIRTAYIGNWNGLASATLMLDTDDNMRLAA